MSKKRNTGAIPGAIMYTGIKSDTPVSINYVEYDSTFHKFEESIHSNQVKIHQSVEKYNQWYDVRGLHDMELMQVIGNAFKIHPLALEDAVDVHQRPTYVDYVDGHFISLKALSFKNGVITREAISIYFGNKYVITFQETESDLFKAIRQRIEQQKGRVVNKGVDYLAYLLLDVIVDNYFQVLDEIEVKVEDLEESISLRAEGVDKLKIYKLKKELLKIRKSIAPLREAVNSLSRSESELIDVKTITFIRDLYDHTIHIIDNADSMRDILSGLQDLYISEISLKMNRVMQILTIITAIFVPLSFLAGLYGMNFENIPELRTQNGYFILLSVMLFIALSMIYYFHRKKWF